MSYTIGQIAELIHESTYTLRYYSKEGLLPFEKRNEHGIRVFEKEDLELFNVIKCLKATHMPIKEIKKFVHWTCQEKCSQQTRNILKVSLS